MEEERNAFLLIFIMVRYFLDILGFRLNYISYILAETKNGLIIHEMKLPMDNFDNNMTSPLRVYNEERCCVLTWRQGTGGR